jgi:hypothetical protein
VSGVERSSAELADAAYEAVRALNHATMPWADDGPAGVDLYRVLGSLTALLHITPQALIQAAARASRMQRQGRIGVDAASPADPAETVAGMQAALARAAALAAQAADLVDAAHEAAAHLIIETDDPGGT